MRSLLLPTVSGKPAVDFQWRWEFEFGPKDIWIGARWYRIGNCVDVLVCLLPCLPLHISWWWHDPDQ